jgi:putative ABC transport system permease protein
MSVRSSVTDVVRRIGGFLRRGSIERRLDSEMQFHLDMLTERHVRAGLSRDEARRAAFVEFGGTERFKDDTRDEYRGRVVDELAQDVRYALRVMRRNPGFATAAALTFALGIGASAAIFSVVHGVLLKPLPYPDPSRLVVLWERNASLELDRNVVSVPNFEAWRERAKSYERVAGAVPFPGVVAGTPNPERVMGAEVSPGYFNLLGVAPALGREFTPEEERDGGANVLVLSDGYWRSRFGGDRTVLGKTLTIDGRVHTIIGVMPASFDPPKFAWLNEQAYWRPFGGTESNRGWGRFLLVLGRLRPNVSVAAASQELDAIATQRATEVKTNEGWSATVISLSQQITGDVRLPLLVLLGAVGLLLLMAVTNVANLMLGLVRRREHELAVRRAIGATSSRLVRQVITQSVALGTIGCVIGFAAAVLGVRVIAAMLPQEMPRATSIGVDTTVVAWMVVVSLVASVAVGAIAAARGGRDDVTTLRETGGGRAAARLRGGALVTAEIALGLVLTVLAGLTMRTFSALRSVNLGFDAEQVVIARVGLSGPRYQTPEARARFFEQLISRMREVPGVQSASAISTRPFGGMAPATTLGDASAPVTGDSVMADVRYVDAQVFKTLRVPMLSGTTFDSHDRLDAPPRAVISNAMARALWPNTDPIGKRLRLPMFNGISPEVIGVVGDMHLMDPRTPVRPTVYLADTKVPVDARDIVIRGAASSDGLVASLRSAVASIDPGVPVSSVTTLSDLVGRSLARDRFTALLLGGFAVASLLLAGVGVYGVFAGDVAQRRKEIGIRVALGGSSGGVVVLVMRRAMARAVVGVALGTVVALLAADAMKSILFGVASTDPISFGGVAVLLLLVAVAATLVPALRAARVSPLVAIRSDL